ncbi:MAG: hypothetical protein ACI4PC_00320 [Oscillospiraceae bacterium]
MAVKKSAVSMMGMCLCMWTCRMCRTYRASRADLLSIHDENRRAA